MKLGGQGEGGYAMATLLVAMALMAIFMSAALPAWSQMAQREKEAEYLFRANQYAIAIKRFQTKMGGTAGMGTPAPSVDFLLEQRFLRKKFKDPLTGKDFVPVLNNQALPGGGQGGGSGALGPLGPSGPSGAFGMSGAFGASGQAPQPGQPNQPGQPGQQTRDTQQAQPTSSLATAKSLATDTLRVSASGPGGSDSARPLTGVTSSSKATALRLFKGQATTYDQWAVTAQDVALHLGGTSIGTRFASQGVGPASQPGQGGQPGGQGTNPFGQPQGTGTGSGFGGAGGFGAPSGTGGSGFGQPSQQGTPVFPQQPFGGGQGGGTRPPGASPFGAKPPQ